MTARSYASTVTFGEDLSGIPGTTLLKVGTLALIGGLAALLRKLKNHDVKIRSMPLEIASDLTSSLVAGLLAWALSEITHSVTPLHVLAKAFGITIAGFLGAKYIDWISQRWLGPRDSLPPRQDDRREPWEERRTKRRPDDESV